MEAQPPQKTARNNQERRKEMPTFNPVSYTHLPAFVSGRKLRASQREKGAERHQDCCQ